MNAKYKNQLKSIRQKLKDQNKKYKNYKDNCKENRLIKVSILWKLNNTNKNVTDLNKTFSYPIPNSMNF